MKEYINLFFKGIGMGAANVIPGVSGGTIALITGIFEKLILSIKSFNITGIKLLFTGRFNDFSKHVNLDFLIAVFLGVGTSIISIAHLFGYLFENYPIYIWSFFFGLILASVFFVGKTIDKWSIAVIIFFVIGTSIALGISILKPATENSSFLYLILCGIIAACSMILPGLSGSFVLILLGNYELVMIDAVNNINLSILLPVVLGAAIGLLAFSYFLSWIFSKYKNQTIALLTGFILGSLGILWPWKNSFDKTMSLIPVNRFGAFTDSSGNLLHEVKVFSYKPILPDISNEVFWFAIAFALLGIVSIWGLEKLAQTKETPAS